MIERAGYKIGFFSVNAAADTVFTTSNTEVFAAVDFAENAAKQIDTLQKQGVDAIVCIVGAAPADSSYTCALYSANGSALIAASTHPYTGYDADRCYYSLTLQAEM